MASYMWSEVSGGSVDSFSTDLIPQMKDQQTDKYVAMTATGNGNCLYNSVSLCVRGDESLAPQLRRAVSIELEMHAAEYAIHPHVQNTSTEKSLKGLDELLIWHTMLCPVAIDQLTVSGIVEAIKIEAKNTAIDRSWSGMLQVMAMSTVLNCEIVSLYPDVPWNFRDLYHHCIKPLEHYGANHMYVSSKRRPIIILWTRDLNFDNTPGMPFVANHVVPVYTVKTTDTVGKRKQAVYNPQKKKLKTQPTLFAYIEHAMTKARTSSTHTSKQTNTTKTPVEQATSRLWPTTPSATQAEETTPRLQSTTQTSTPAEQATPAPQPTTTDLATPAEQATPAPQPTTTHLATPAEQSTPEKSVISSEDDSTPQASNCENNESHSTYCEDVKENTLLPLDICNYLSSSLSDEKKYQLIKLRVPESNYKFPPKEYKDNRRKGGIQRRYCLHEYFHRFRFISYSKYNDGLYCIACVFFPSKAHQGERAKILISKPYRNWKDARTDIVKHSALQYHRDSMAKFDEFIARVENHHKKIECILTTQNQKMITKNRVFLKSILSCIELCGRQGFALRGHRDDDTCSNINKGNFKALLEHTAKTDIIMKAHLEMCNKNATYTSKTTQNDLLGIVKDYIQGQIVNEIKDQPVSGLFGIMADEVTDSGSWEQLGLVLRYIGQNNIPVERLLEFVKCESITGIAIANKILKALTDNGLDPSKCRSQTYDGAGNMAGCQRGCAAIIQKEAAPRAPYMHCASHNLNLALSKASSSPEMKCMLSNLTTLGLFFKYSNKRLRCLEKSVSDINVKRPVDQKIAKTKVKPMCQTRWIERHTTLDDFANLYEPLLDCLEVMSSQSGWDTKTTTEADGLRCQLTSSKFIVAFHTCLHMFGYTKPLSVKLQKSSIDVVRAYSEIELVLKEFKSIRDTAETVFAKLYTDIMNMSQVSGGDITVPRQCGRQTLRNNLPAESAEIYYRRTIFIPFVDHLIVELETRFCTLSNNAVKAFYLLPKNVHEVNDNVVKNLESFYGLDLPSPRSLWQEIRIWKQLWRSEDTNNSPLPDTIVQTLCHKDVSITSYPNVCTMLHIILSTPVTSAGVERANSTLRYVKNVYRSQMLEDRLNSLLLMYIHRDIQLDYDIIVNMYARKYPRRMLFLNPLDEK